MQYRSRGGLKGTCAILDREGGVHYEQQSLLVPEKKERMGGGEEKGWFQTRFRGIPRALQWAIHRTVQKEKVTPGGTSKNTKGRTQNSLCGEDVRKERAGTEHGGEGGSKFVGLPKP